MTLIFIVGCPAAGTVLQTPVPVETPIAQSKPAEHSALLKLTRPETAPNVAEPNIAGVAVAEVNGPGPNPTQAHKSEPNVPEVNRPQANVPEANKAEPNAVEPNAPGRAAAMAFYRTYADLLHKFVDKDGMVAYRKLNIRRMDLEQFLNQLAKLDRKQYNSWPREDRIALWVNAYNVQMLKNILLNYPIKSSAFPRMWWAPTDIRHIEPMGEIATKKWDQYKLIVMNEEFNLSAVEDKIFEDFNDPRIFVATTHATLSGPPLLNKPYYGFNLSKQLDAQAGKFLSNPLAFRIDRREKKVYLSAMFDPTWYGPRFTRKYGTDKMFKALPPPTRAVLNFIAGYVSPKDRLFLERETYSLTYINYDWRLNDNSDNH